MPELTLPDTFASDGFLQRIEKVFFSLANFPHFTGIHEIGGSSKMRMTHLFRFACAFLFTALWFACVGMGQTETATVSGLITDETGAAVPGAEAKLQSLDRGTVTTATTQPMMRGFMYSQASAPANIK